jgi:glutamine---fructose-6-phosphate transaminase (isomerizing)
MEEKTQRRLDILSSQIVQVENDDKNNESNENCLIENTIEINDTCGIVCYVGKNDAFDYLFGGLKILQNRGYDSAGVCTISDNNDFVVTKFASISTTNDALERLEKSGNQHKDNKIGKFVKIK